MLKIVITLLLFFLCVLICDVFAAVGFFMGVKWNLPFKREKPPPESEQVKTAKKKAERELKNLMSYNGDEQE